jgi:dTDP-L-rhamnose 4-epimerase
MIVEEIIMKKVLISGGAGFIGSSLALRLLKDGVSVRILDNLSPQIHGADAESSFLFSRVKAHVDFLKGDVRNRADWEKALADCDSVVHLAAETGTGQSMYRICHYTDVNVQGTAILMELAASKAYPIERIVIASSRAVYGEGKYLCPDHGAVYPSGRLEKDMSAGHFEPRCPVCGNFVDTTPTDENSLLKPTSLYGVTKLTQEQIVMTMGAALGLPCIGLRFQNVYGPGQSLHNPYTGILAIFTTLLLAGKKINIFEDGYESRDFVFIDDVVESISLALRGGKGDGKVFNIGTGIPLNVIDTATYLKDLVGGNSEISVSGNFRLGDIRHNVADLTLAASCLGYKPLVENKDGIKRYVNWVLTQQLPKSEYEESLEEMRKKGLFK